MQKMEGDRMSRRNELTLEAMLLELQRRYGAFTLTATADGRWNAMYFDGKRLYDYSGRTPLAAVVQAYRAVVSESDDKEER
jgi:hypothetical protein